MLALSITFLGALALLGPDLVSRWILGFVVPRRNLGQGRGEELTRATIWALFPLGLSFLWMRAGGLHRWGTWQDVQTTVSGLYSTPYFESHREEFFRSLPKVGGMCFSALWRLYLFVVTIALLLNGVIAHYRWFRNRLKSGWTRSLLATLVLPRISEWHVLLSDMLLPVEDVLLVADVLTKSGTIYQGEVADRMLALDGSLLTLTISEPKRFRREEFHRAQALNAEVVAEAYWKAIPSKLFVILGTDIANVNVRYPPRNPETAPQRPDLTPAELSALRALLAKLPGMPDQL